MILAESHVAAQIADKLVTTKFKNSITRGFAAVGEPHVAVCLLPGTEIAFDENVECEPSFGIGILPNKKIEQRLARFRQINTDNAVTHHDALEFSDGHVVLLKLGSLNMLMADLRKRGIVTKVRTLKTGETVGGIPFTRGS